MLPAFLLLFFLTIEFHHSTKHALSTSEKLGSNTFSFAEVAVQEGIFWDSGERSDTNHSCSSIKYLKIYGLYNKLCIFLHLFLCTTWMQGRSFTHAWADKAISFGWFMCLSSPQGNSTFHDLSCFLFCLKMVLVFHCYYYYYYKCNLYLQSDSPDKRNLRKTKNWTWRFSRNLVISTGANYLNLSFLHGFSSASSMFSSYYWMASL